MEFKVNVARVTTDEYQYDKAVVAVYDGAVQIFDRRGRLMETLELNTDEEMVVNQDGDEVSWTAGPWTILRLTTCGCGGMHRQPRPT